MVFVLFTLAAGLAVATYAARDRGTRLWLAFWCLVNLAAGIKMIVDDFPFAYRLLPNPGYSEPAYRRY